MKDRTVENSTRENFKRSAAFVLAAATIGSAERVHANSTLQSSPDIPNRQVREYTPPTISELAIGDRLTRFERETQTIYVDERAQETSQQRQELPEHVGTTIVLATDLLPSGTVDILSEPVVQDSLQRIDQQLTSLIQLVNPSDHKSDYLINVVSAPLQQGGVGVTYVIQRDRTLYFADAFSGVLTPVDTNLLNANVLVLNENGLDRLIPVIYLPDGTAAEILLDENGTAVDYRPIDLSTLRQPNVELARSVSEATISAGGPVNIRADATTGSAVVGVLSPDLSVLVTGSGVNDAINKVWYPVHISGIDGWVRGDLLRFTEDEATDQMPLVMQITPEAGRILLAKAGSGGAAESNESVERVVMAPELPSITHRSVVHLENSFSIEGENRRLIMFVQTDELSNMPAKWNPGVMSLNDVENFVPSAVLEINGSPTELTSQEAVSLSVEQSIFRIAKEQGVVKDSATLEEFLADPLPTLITPENRSITLRGGSGPISFNINNGVIFRLRGFSEQIPNNIERTTTDFGSFVRSLDAQGNLILDVYLSSLPQVKSRFDFSNDTNAFAAPRSYTVAVAASVLTLGSSNVRLDAGGVFRVYYSQLPGGYVVNHRSFIEDIYTPKEQVYLTYSITRAGTPEYNFDVAISEEKQLFSFD